MSNIVRPPCDDGVIRSGGVTVLCEKSAGPWILAATILGSSMVFIDGTVVNVALPALQDKLNATVVDVQWVVESYALFLAALLLAGGSLGDHFGRRRIYAIGVSIFALASIWCAVAPNIMHLILARAFQGIGGALLVPGSLALISASFDKDERGKAIGTWSGFTAITAAVGPVFGGWLIENISWRAVFLINIPFAIVVVILAFKYIPESRDPDARKLDLTGALLATTSLGALVYGLIESSRLGFSHPAIIVALTGGFVSAVLFLWIESRKHEPMLPLSLFRSRNFSGANLLTLFLYTALSGGLFFLPLNLIQVQGYTATAAGAALLPFVLIMFLLSRWSGGLIKRYGPRLPLVIGPLIASVGYILFRIPGVGGSYWTTLFPAIVVLGFGMAISVAPLTTTVMNSVSETRAGLASGINNAVSRTAGLLAVAVLSLVMFHTFNAELNQQLAKSGTVNIAEYLPGNERIKLAGAIVPRNIPMEAQTELRRVIDESFLSGFRTIMLINACLAVLSALSAWIVIRS